MTDRTHFRPEQAHATAFIAPSATVVGDVTLSAESSVWFGAVLRGDTDRIEVGERTNIQDGAILHADAGFPCILGSGVTVGHRVILHGCTVEDDCLIGMGSILLDNVKIGRGSLIGAGSLLTYGTVIPPGSLVMGSPGKVVRPVKDKEVGMIEGGWRTYVEYAAKYLKERAARGR